MTERAPLHEFQAYGKTPRLNKQITVTEKIDGSNCAVMIRPIHDDLELQEHETSVWIGNEDTQADEEFKVFALGCQSRNRLIRPGKTSDNAGFAAWAWDHAKTLVEGLGIGRHFGEWWGPGVQFDYGLPQGTKRFSLFNPFTWGLANEGPPELRAIGVRTVPLLLQWGRFDTSKIDEAIGNLSICGSKAAADEGVFGAKAEGVIIRHSDSGQLFKRLIENDDIPKSLVQS